MNWRIITPIAFLSVAIAAVVLVFIGLTHPQAPRAHPPSDISEDLAHLKHTAPSFTPEEREVIELDRIIHEQGLARAWKFLKINYAEADGVRGNPHFLAHFFGRRVYDKFGIGGARLCDKSFSNGCYHGVFDAAIREQGKDSVIAARDLCYDSGRVGIRASCIHGIGHGLLAGRTQLADLEEALDGCEVVPIEARPSCQDGVFMEYFFSSQESAFSAKGLWYPCSAISEIYRPRCSRMQPQILRAKRNVPMSAIADICLSANDPAMTDNCFEGLGMFIGILSKGQAENVKRGCGTMPNHSRKDQCFTFAAGQLVFQQYQDAEHRAPKLCNEVSENAKTSCLSHIKNMRGPPQP